MKTIVIKLLQKLINDFKADNTNITEEDEEKIIDLIKEIRNKESQFSKYQAYNYLGVSRATFDNLVKEGVLPKGIKVAGFKELRWNKKDLDKYVEKQKSTLK